MADIHWLWSSGSLGAQLTRGALLPAAALFRAAAAARNALYDMRVLPARDLALPAVSVGNLTVGGTGKTPVSQWLAAKLAAMGVRPAIVLRGYGHDEAMVHRALMPNAIVVENADRVAGTDEAKRKGADVVVLDDAFQHRRAGRTVDIVLISADAWSDSRWPLPAGPWRESITSVRRAHLVVITRKAALPETVDAVSAHVRSVAPDTPVAVAELTADTVVEWPAKRTVPAKAFEGKRVLALSGIGDPRPFERQLASLGARVFPVRFEDHHNYSPDDVRMVSAQLTALDAVICTLKDAVKLGPLWPRGGPPLWYLSQRVSLVRGDESLAGLLEKLLAARRVPAVPSNP